MSSSALLSKLYTVFSGYLAETGESKEPFSWYTKWFISQIAPRYTVKDIERGLILQYKGPILQVNHFTGYCNHLPTQMHCFVIFNVLNLNEFLAEVMYVWSKIYGMALGSQAFLSLCKMKEIQLSNTNLPQPAVNFWFEYNFSYLFSYLLFDLYFVFRLLTWIARHTCKLKQFFLFRLSKTPFALSIWTQHPCWSSEQKTISWSNFKSFSLNDVAPVI